MTEEGLGGDRGGGMSDREEVRKKGRRKSGWMRYFLPANSLWVSVKI